MPYSIFGFPDVYLGVSYNKLVRHIEDWQNNENPGLNYSSIDFDRVSWNAGDRETGGKL